MVSLPCLTKKKYSQRHPGNTGWFRTTGQYFGKW